MNNHRLESGARLKATDARNIPEPVKVALRIRDRVAQNQEELLKWIRDLNPGLHTEHWRVLNKQPEPKGLRLILLIDRDSYTCIRRTDTGFLQGSHRELLKSCETLRLRISRKTESSKSVSEEEGDDIPTPSDDRMRQIRGQP
jgi:hypothetical protein